MFPFFHKNPFTEGQVLKNYYYLTLIGVSQAVDASEDNHDIVLCTLVHIPRALAFVSNEL